MAVSLATAAQALMNAGLFSTAALACFVALMSTLLLPAHLLWDRFTCSYVLHCWQEYFHFSWIVEEQVVGKDTVIFAEYPHGTLNTAHTAHHYSCFSSSGAAGDNLTCMVVFDDRCRKQVSVFCAVDQFAAVAAAAEFPQ